MRLRKITFHSDLPKRGLLAVVPLLVLLPVAGVVGQENFLGCHVQGPTTNSNELSPLLHAYLTKLSNFSWRNDLVAEEKEGFILYEKGLIKSKVKGAKSHNSKNVRLFLGKFVGIVSEVNLCSITCIHALCYYLKLLWFEGEFLLSSSETEELSTL